MTLDNAEPDWSLSPKQRATAAPTPTTSSAPQVMTARQAWLNRIAVPSYTPWRSWMRWQRIFLQQASVYTPEALTERLAELETLNQQCQASLTKILAEETQTGQPCGPAWEKVDEQRLRYLGQAGAIREALAWWKKRLMHDLPTASPGCEPLPLSAFYDPFQEE